MDDSVEQEATASSLLSFPLQVSSRPQRRAPRVHTKEEWEAQRDIIEQLYITENKTLEEVTERLEHNYGFYATVRQYKRRIKDWCLDSKNLKNCEMKAIVRKQRQRIAEGKKSVFEVRGHQVDPTKIQRAKKRYGNFNSVTASHSSPAAPTPSDVVCYTPDNGASSEHKVQDSNTIDNIHQLQAGIYWPSSPAPNQNLSNLSNAFSPQSYSTIHRIPGTPGTPFFTHILNSTTDNFTGESPAPFPATPVPSAAQLFNGNASNLDASMSSGNKGLHSTTMEQYSFDSSEWFPNTDFFSLDTRLDLVVEMLDENQNLGSKIAPPRPRRYKEEQENDFKQKLHELESVHGLGHPATIHIRLGLAGVFHDQGRFRAAELTFRQAASTCQKYLGNNHVLTFEAVNGLLHTFFSQGHGSIAETHYQSLCKRALVVFGREHELVLTISLNAANVSSSLKKWKEAELLEREVFEICSKKYGLEDRKIILAMRNLSVSLIHLHRVEEGERLLRDVIRLEEKLPRTEDDRLHSKLQLGRLYKRQGRYEESETMFREISEHHRSLLGPEHPERAIVLSDLAWTLRLQKKFAEGKKAISEALAINVKVLGSSHPNTRDDQLTLDSWPEQ